MMENNLFKDSLRSELGQMMDLHPSKAITKDSVMEFIYGRPTGIEFRKHQMCDFLVSRMLEVKA